MGGRRHVADAMGTNSRRCPRGVGNDLPARASRALGLDDADNLKACDEMAKRVVGGGEEICNFTDVRKGWGTDT